MVEKDAPSADAHRLLGDIYLRQGKTSEAANIYRRAAANQKLRQQDRDDFSAMLNTVFASSEAHVVSFANPYTGGESANTVYLAQLA